MKKSEVIEELKKLGVEPNETKTVPELKKELKKAQDKAAKEEVEAQQKAQLQAEYAKYSKEPLDVSKSVADIKKDVAKAKKAWEKKQEAKAAENELKRMVTFIEGSTGQKLKDDIKPAEVKKMYKGLMEVKQRFEDVAAELSTNGITWPGGLDIDELEAYRDRQLAKLKARTSDFPFFVHEDVKDERYCVAFGQGKNLTALYAVSKYYDDEADAERLLKKLKKQPEKVVGTGDIIRRAPVDKYINQKSK